MFLYLEIAYVLLSCVMFVWSIHWTKPILFPVFDSFRVQSPDEEETLTASDSDEEEGFEPVHPVLPTIQEMSRWLVYWESVFF